MTLIWGKYALIRFLTDTLAVYNSHQHSAHQSTASRQGHAVSHSDFPDDYTANIDSSLTITGLQRETDCADQIPLV